MLQRAASACLSGGRAGSPASTARPSGTSRGVCDRDDGLRERLRELSRRASALGLPARLGESCAVRAGRRTARRSSGCGAKRACGCRPSGASGNGSATSTAPAARLRAERPDQVWALDFQFDTTVDGRVLKLLHVVDEHTREALAIQVERRIDSDHTVSVLDRIVRERGRRTRAACAWTTAPS